MPDTKHTKSSAKKAPESLSHEVVLETFRKAMRPLNLDALLRVLGVQRRAKKRLEGILADLMAEGEILRLRGGSYGLMTQLKLVTGQLRVQRSGAGFVEPESGGAPLYIPAASMGDAWHGDTVAVARVPGSHAGHGLSAEGRVARVLKRAATEMPLTALRWAGEMLVAASADSRIRAHFLVEGADPKEVSYGSLILAAPGEKLDSQSAVGGLWAARMVSVLGAENSVAAQEQIVKITHGAPAAFPQAALDEAAKLPVAPLPAEINEAGREDLRHIPFVTIDGADARDFDDAIQVEQTEKGWLLRVAIADVAYYVRPGSALDKEARERGNSWYFPQSVEPMLPEALCNGLCSLRPDEPRLAMVAELHFNHEGQRTGERFFSACIQSRARLVYDDVSNFLESDPDSNPGSGSESAFDSAVFAEHGPMLRRAAALAEALRAARVERGSLDFNVPEAQVLFDEQGGISGVVARPLGVSNHIIEECMLAANEAVARFLHSKHLPVLYRVHPAPDPEKLEGLFASLSATGLAQNVKRGGAATLRKLLAEKGNEQQQFIIRRLALRTMMQARYSPERERHFGLAAEYYCHFTSPIRRYADLIVHRSLRKALGLSVYGELPTEQEMERIAQGINSCERSAVGAEREILRRLSVLFMSEKVGEVYEGIISGVLDFGFFVECREVMAEGMVRLSSVYGDYFRYDPVRQELLGERTGRAFRLGQPVTVEVQDVSLGRLEINFALAHENEGNGRGPRQAPGRAKKSAKRDSAGRGGRGTSTKKPGGKSGAKKSSGAKNTDRQGGAGNRQSRSGKPSSRKGGRS